MNQLSQNRDDGLNLHKQLQILKIIELVFFSSEVKKLIPYVLLERECSKLRNNKPASGLYSGISSPTFTKTSQCNNLKAAFHKIRE